MWLHAACVVYCDRWVVGLCFAGLSSDFFSMIISTIFNRKGSPRARRTTWLTLLRQCIGNWHLNVGESRNSQRLCVILRRPIMANHESRIVVSVHQLAKPAVAAIILCCKTRNNRGGTTQSEIVWTTNKFGGSDKNRLKCNPIKLSVYGIYISTSMSIPSAVFRLPSCAREILDISSILDIKFSIYRLWEKTDIDGRYLMVLPQTSHTSTMQSF